MARKHVWGPQAPRFQRTLAWVVIVNRTSKTIVVAAMGLVMTVVTTSTAPAQMSAVHSGTNTLDSVGHPPGGPRGERGRGWTCSTIDDAPLEGTIHEDPERIWPFGVVPYEFDEGVEPENRALFLAALVGLTDVCDVQFVEHTDEPDYVVIRWSDDGGNSSSIGRQGGVQFINITNWGVPFIVQHEMMHTLAFLHEQSRHDRDTYVRILFDNIYPGC